MSSLQDLEGLMQRTRRYWYEDGFADLGTGGFLLLFSLFLAAQALTPQGSPLWLIWGVGTPLVLIGGGLVGGWLVKHLKSSLTYPRTGYVNYERTGASRAAQLIGTMLLAALVAAGFVMISRSWQNLTLLFGIPFAAAFGFVGYRVGLVRYLLLALWSLFLGLILVPLSLTMEQGGALYLAGIGLALIVSGWINWRRYVRRAPNPREE